MNDIYIPPLNKILSIVDFDDMFLRNPDAKIINQNSLVSSNVAKEYTDAVFSDLDEEISFVATCKCGSMVGSYYEGSVCLKCKSIVTTAFGDLLTHNNWIGVPEGFPPLLNPLLYEMLRKWGEPARNETSIIECILNPDIKYPDDWLPPVIGKGFKYFHENYDVLMNYLFNNYPSTSKKVNNEEFKKFLAIHRDRLFCYKLPILHSSLHSSTKSGQMRFVDKTAKEILQAIAEMSCMAFMKKKSIMHYKAIDRTLFNVLTKCLEYIVNLTKSKLGDKLAIGG